MVRLRNRELGDFHTYNDERPKHPKLYKNYREDYDTGENGEKFCLQNAPPRQGPSTAAASAVAGRRSTIDQGVDPQGTSQTKHSNAIQYTIIEPNDIHFLGYDLRTPNRRGQNHWKTSGLSTVDLDKCADT
uniref:Uncharacterized protein n=1 Tax=Romanomermis culicivorax TaxID=13658 RepID=A0A915JIQ8_ROMCU